MLRGLQLTIAADHLISQPAKAVLALKGKPLLLPRVRGEEAAEYALEHCHLPGRSLFPLVRRQTPEKEKFEVITARDDVVDQLLSGLALRRLHDLEKV